MIRTLFRTVVHLTLAAFLFAAAGCLISSHSTARQSGTAVPEGTLRQIELGRTSEAWLVAALGDPSTRCAVRGPDNVEILCYKHEQIRQSRGSVFLLLNTSSHKVDRAATCFEVTDGVITRYWAQ